jgi:hypothetical protein
MYLPGNAPHISCSAAPSTNRMTKEQKTMIPKEGKRNIPQ